MSALGFIARLYQIDRDTMDMQVEQRTRERSARAGPVLTDFLSWLDERALEIIVVPATRTIRGIGTEVFVSEADDMLALCALNFDHVGLAAYAGLAHEFARTLYGSSC